VDLAAAPPLDTSPAAARCALADACDRAGRLSELSRVLEQRLWPDTVRRDLPAPRLNGFGLEWLDVVSLCPALFPRHRPPGRTSPACAVMGLGNFAAFAGL